MYRYLSSAFCLFSSAFCFQRSSEQMLVPPNNKCSPSSNEAIISSPIRSCATGFVSESGVLLSFLSRRAICCEKCPMTKFPKVPSEFLCHVLPRMRVGSGEIWCKSAMKQSKTFQERSNLPRICADAGFTRSVSMGQCS